ncbi:MAG TPA: hypothetical protein VLM89_10020 [Phycisphaerae bacterium]|nr:hypothetical protein [Phycisphaerae bacterium]
MKACIHLFLVSAVLTAATIGPAGARGVETPASQPATSSAPASQPATSSAPAPLDPALEAILDRLEKMGVRIDSIEADIEFIKIDPVLDDRQEYKGILRFKQLKPNPRFFIRFDIFKHDGVTRHSKQWHVFDGQWYIEARESTSTITKNEIVRPGETIEVFKLGRGPFPLPFGQTKSDILRHFTVRLVKSAPDDPPNCDHLECTPLAGTDMARKYDVVHFLVDRKLDLPVRVETVEKQEGNRIIATFSNVKVNPGLVESQLNLPDLKNYSIDTNPLQSSDNNEDKGP